MSALSIETQLPEAISNPLSDASEPFSLLNITRRTALAAGALGTLALLLPAFPARADFDYGDVKTLRFLEEVARLQADFSFKAAMSMAVEGFSERERDAFSLITRQDSEVVRWFGSARDKNSISAFDGFSTRNQASSRRAPTYLFNGETFKDRAAILARALEIKGLTVGAYHGAVGKVANPKLIQAFAALAGVQGRHLAVLNDIDGQPPFTPVETAMPLSEVATKLAPYGFNAEILG